MPQSLEPVWMDPEERFVVAVGRDEAVTCDITLEVWDDDDLGQGDFLGQVRRRRRINFEWTDWGLKCGETELSLRMQFPSRAYPFAEHTSAG